MDNLFTNVYKAIKITEPLEKCLAIKNLYENFTKFNLDKIKITRITIPGRPKKPKLVDFKDVPNRKKGDIGLIHTIHAICHIEFNAINLALDAVYRFQDLPEEYYYDWLQVAKEECYHFSLVQNYLKEIGYKYGDFDAHNGLWEMALKTDSDILERMALVPRLLEARGLDVNPLIKKKFINSRYVKMPDLLDIILKDEIGHVKIGSYWFDYICKKRNLNNEDTFIALIKKHIGEKLKPPVNIEARKQAGFKIRELNYING